MKLYGMLILIVSFSSFEIAYAMQAPTKEQAEEVTLSSVKGAFSLLRQKAGNHELGAKQALTDLKSIVDDPAKVDEKISKFSDVSKKELAEVGLLEYKNKMNSMILKIIQNNSKKLFKGL